MRQVALLRGVNVGGKNKVPMKELAALFGEAGCTEVTTYIQSGNVVFSSTTKLAKGLTETISTAISKRFGWRVPVVLRTLAELEKVVSANPFLPAGPVEQLHVAFLDVAPTAVQVAALDAPRFLPDELTVRGRDVFLRLPHGVGKSKLTNAYLDSRLKAVSTLRNWRTVLQLVEMCRAA